MRFPTFRSNALGTTGLTGIVLMTLHITGYLSGWWAILYVTLILAGIGQENNNNYGDGNGNTRNDRP